MLSATRGFITIIVITLLLIFDLGLNGAAELKEVDSYAALR